MTDKIGESDIQIRSTYVAHTDSMQYWLDVRNVTFRQIHTIEQAEEIKREIISSVELKKKIEDVLKELEDDITRPNYLNEDGKQFARQYRCNLELLLKSVL